MAKCLHSLLIPNPKKELGIYDDPFIYVPCGHCINCRKNKQQNWRVRLFKEFELGKHKNCLFVTFTLANEHYDRFKDNPALAIRLFFERIRKCTGKSLLHFMVTELGEQNRRLHFHGLIFDCSLSYNKLRELWGYGISWIEPLRSIQGITYITTYMLKDTENDFVSRVYVSAGIGKCYLTPDSYRFHRDNDVCTIVLGRCIYGLPRYYYSKIFDEDARLSKKLLAIFEPKPPTYTYKGISFPTATELQNYLDTLYADTIKRGTSIKLINRNYYVTSSESISKITEIK